MTDQIAITLPRDVVEGIARRNWPEGHGYINSHLTPAIYEACLEAVNNPTPELIKGTQEALNNLTTRGNQ